MQSHRPLFFEHPSYSLPIWSPLARPPSVSKRADAELVDRMNAELMAHEALYNERLLRAMCGETLERQVPMGSHAVGQSITALQHIAHIIAEYFAPL